MLLTKFSTSTNSFILQNSIESQLLRLGAEAYCLSISPMIPSGPKNSNLCINRNTLRKASAMKPGASSKELFNIYFGLLEEKGYSKFSRYGSIHSVGMLECESPFFSSERDVYLKENMTVCIDAYFKDLPWGHSA